MLWINRRYLAWLLGAALQFIVAAASAAPDGQKLYHHHCAVCHNDDGMGGIGLPLKTAKIDHLPRDYLFKTIRHGRPGRVMPAFEKLSDAQVNAIVDHVFKWKKSDSPVSFPTDRIKGNHQHGAALFQEHCAECHGEDGKSKGVGTGVTVSRERHFEVIPPALNNPGFLASASDAWIRHTIANGRPGTIMPSAAKLGLSERDMDDLVAYIRSFEDRLMAQTEEESEPPTFIFDSPYDFATTVGNLKQSLQGLNFRYFPDRYLEMGLAEDEVINKKQLSLRFCNFQRLYEMINIEPRLGVVLPCRVTVVEDDAGEVKIYVMNMKMVSRLFNNTQLDETARQMHETLMEVIDEATL